MWKLLYNLTIRLRVSRSPNIDHSQPWFNQVLWRTKRTRNSDRFGIAISTYRLLNFCYRLIRLIVDYLNFRLRTISYIVLGRITIVCIVSLLYCNHWCLSNKTSVPRIFFMRNTTKYLYQEFIIKSIQFHMANGTFETIIETLKKPLIPKKNDVFIHIIDDLYTVCSWCIGTMKIQRRIQISVENKFLIICK